MTFAAESMKVYKSIKVLFSTPMYDRALQLCWHAPSYKSMIALVSQLLRLQRRHQLPSAVTAENMTELLAVQRKEALRVQSLWESELGTCDADIRPLLQLAWKVNISMKMRDIEFEARRLLRSPGAVPPHFQHPTIMKQACMYAKILTKQQRKGPVSRLLCPMEVVLEVVPKVVQGFWLPPPNTSFNMPSQQLSKMAVGVTKAVQDRVSKALSSVLLQATFSSLIRDKVVRSIRGKIRRGYPEEVLEKRLNCFGTEVLNTITNVAVQEICELFQSQGVLTSSDEPPAAVVSTPPCAPTTSDEPPIQTASPEPDSAVVKTTKKGKFRRFVKWLQKKNCCCVTSADNEPN